MVVFRHLTLNRWGIGAVEAVGALPRSGSCRWACTAQDAVHNLVAARVDFKSLEAFTTPLLVNEAKPEVQVRLKAGTCMPVPASMGLNRMLGSKLRIEPLQLLVLY